MANTPFGSSPFLGTGAPFAVHQWKWSALFITKKTGRSGDATVDLLNRSMDLGRQVRLVYIHDDGYERICDAIGYLTDAPVAVEGQFDVTIAVTWELLTPWRERNPVNVAHHAGSGLRAGQTSPQIRAGSAASVLISSTAFALPTTMCDATAAGPGGVPSASDTGPVVTIVGPFGGDGGFSLANGAAVPSLVNINLKIPVKSTLSLDFGAKDYLLTDSTGATTDVSQYISPTLTQGYDFMIRAGDTNPIALTCLGTPASFTSGGSVNIQWQRLFA